MSTLAKRLPFTFRSEQHEAEAPFSGTLSRTLLLPLVPSHWVRLAYATGHLRIGIIGRTLASRLTSR